MAFGHGKLILLGEHSVVYGKPAIAVALPQGAEAQAELVPRSRLSVQPWAVDIEASTPHDDPRTEMLRQAFVALLDLYPEKPEVHVTARVALPGSAGLGGSAALSVAVVRAIDGLLGIERSANDVGTAALAAERVFHGNPSGIDSAMAAAGGVALYRRGQPLEPLKLARRLTLVVGDSGAPSSTHDTVASVARQHSLNPPKLEQIFDGIEALVLNAKTALQTGETGRLGELMTLNQKLLNAMLLSTSGLEEMCRAAEKAGALGAKLTGGGGGGCMIALVEHAAQAQSVLEALRGLVKDAFVTEVSA